MKFFMLEKFKSRKLQNLVLLLILLIITVILMNIILKEDEKEEAENKLKRKHFSKGDFKCTNRNKIRKYAFKNRRSRGYFYFTNL